MADALIELRDVHFAYAPDRPVLNGVELTLQPGQRLALHGDNGSGKTTLLHACVGLVKPQRGEVIVFGEPRRHERDFNEVRRRLGLLFQDADDQLFCPTVAEDIAFGLLNLGMQRDAVRQRVAQTLGNLGLDDYADRITYRLSGGEKRLVALATVLAMPVEALLLDEPTAGLDATMRRRLIEILTSINQAMLVVSHDEPFIEQVTNSAARLERGRVSLSS